MAFFFLVPSYFSTAMGVGWSEHSKTGTNDDR